MMTLVQKQYKEDCVFGRFQVSELNNSKDLFCSKTPLMVEGRHRTTLRASIQ